MTALMVALLIGALLGLSLGTLGAGGAILAVPVLVHALGQSPTQATTGSLVVVGVTAVIAAVAARRTGGPESGPALAQGLVFGALASGGAVLGSTWAAQMDEDLLLVGFGLLMIVVAVLTWLRRGEHGDVPVLDTPILSFRPTFACQCPRAAKVLVTATAVGLLTGLFGVGGGFLVVPALVLALGMDLRRAASTSLVVITVTSAVALTARLGHGIRPDLLPVLALTTAASVGALAGIRLVGRVDPRRLRTAFPALLGVVGLAVTVTAVSALG